MLGLDSESSSQRMGRGKGIFQRSAQALACLPCRALALGTRCGARQGLDIAHALTCCVPRTVT